MWPSPAKVSLSHAFVQLYETGQLKSRIWQVYGPVLCTVYRCRRICFLIRPSKAVPRLVSGWAWLASRGTLPYP